MIPFNVPPFVGTELDYIKDAVEDRHISGDGKYTKKSSEWLEKTLGANKVLLTTSCTHATEMAAILGEIQPGDEVIMPSYTFVSTADAFVLRGARIIFIDIRPDTMNIDENLIERAITKRTKAIVPVHYAGVSCEMDTIMDIARRHNLLVIEDAAQGVLGKYKGAYLGTIGDYGCFSFHETKNYSMGEGGAIVIKNEDMFEPAEIIREKALHALNDEVPHGIAVAIDQMKERKGGNMFDIDATIVCERDSHKGIIIGKQGAMLKKIGTNARYEMERLLDAKVNLKLWVKVKKDWRDSDFLIKNFGYHDDDK